MAAPGTDVLPDASRFGAEASTTALKVVASAPGLQEDHMRFAPLLVALACGCATSSSSGPPSGGTEPADARERGGSSPDSGPGAAAGGGLLVVTVSDLSVDNVVGRSVVVHEKQDDLHSDPAGNSGARIACGVMRGE